jgi:REG-2-like HAD superfamily hydrolase
MRQEGLEVSSEEAERALQAAVPGIVEVLERTGNDTWSTSREVSRQFWRSIYSTAFDELGISDSQGRLFEALYHRFTQHDSYRLFPDALPTLGGLRELGLALGVISNWEEWLESLLVTMEVAELFDVIVVSGQVGIEKPDARIFHLALEQAGVEPADAVYVGDHPKLDVEASEAVGMVPVLLDRRGRHPEHPGTRITALDELSGVIGVGGGVAAPASRQGRSS